VQGLLQAVFSPLPSRCHKTVSMKTLRWKHYKQSSSNTISVRALFLTLPLPFRCHKTVLDNRVEWKKLFFDFKLLIVTKSCLMVWIENTKNLNFFEHASVSTWGSKFPKMAFFHENLRFLEKKKFLEGRHCKIQYTIR